MVALFTALRKVTATVPALLAALALAACQPIGSVGGGPTIDTRAPVQVALLLPQTGNTAGFAQGLENAARLAARDQDGADIRIATYDTQGTAAGAAAAAARAADDGARIILGPLFSDTTPAAAQAVAARGLNVLSFSNNPAIAGGNVFILGTTFQSSADRLAAYARGRGVRDIAIVHAQSVPEELGRDAIARALGQNGLRLARSSSFELSQNGIVSAAPRIVSEIRASGASGVFLTSSIDGAIPFLADLLPSAGLDTSTVQMISLQRVDTVGSALSLRGLQGTWFAAPDPGLSSQFANAYEAAFGARPDPVFGLAYDGVAAIGQLVAAGQSDALTGRALTRRNGFSGVTGIFRLQPDGTNQRGLAVAQIRNNQVVVIDPAPRSFGGPGF